MFLAIIFSIMPAANGQSESAIYGTVTAKVDASSVADATIRVESTSGSTALTTVTDSDGHFMVRSLVPGPYSLTASREGFLTLTLQITLKPREVQTVTFQLPLRSISESVEVTGSPESTLSTYSPSSTTVERQFIDGLPLGQRNNVPDMIAAVAPGMIRSHDDFVHVRGNEIALNTFINGVSFWENPHSVFSAGLSPDIIQSMNVMTGGFPAEYGNRFGGVLDIVTKSGFFKDNELALTLGSGNALRNNVAIEYGGHSDRAAYFLYSSGFESGRFISPNDPRSIHDTGRGSRNFLQLDFNHSPNDSFKFVLMGDGTNFQIPKTATDDTYRPNANASERTRSQTAIFTWNRIVSSRTLVTTSAYQRWSRMSLLPGDDPLASFAVNERTLLTAGLKSDVTRIAGAHTLKAGFDLSLLRPDEGLFFYGEGYIAFSHLLHLPHVHLRGPDRGPIRFSQQKTGGAGSAYFQDTVQLTKSLSANVGLRFDRYSLAMSSAHLSPRVNVAYRFGSSTVLHASYDHFFVPPAVENVLISSAGLSRFLQDFGEPLPPLQPIRENQFEVGVSRQIRGLRLGLTGYYRDSKNPVHTVLFPDSRIYAYANFDKGKAYGMETKAELPVSSRHGLSAYANYALSRVYFWNPVLAGFIDETHHLEESGRFLAPMDQTHTFNSGFLFRHRRSGLSASMSFEYGSGTPTEVEDETDSGASEPTPLRVPGHFTQNLTIGMDVLRQGDRPRMSLQFNIENLTNNVYKVSQESTFSPGEYFHPRFFSGSMKIRF
jgi:hypothetical protein